MTAQDDGAQHMDDEALLARAMSLNRVLVTSDHDFLSEVPRPELLTFLSLAGQHHQQLGTWYLCD
jgi:hypothetical protein